MFPLLLLCLSLFTPVSTVTPRIKPSHTSITIDKGKFDTVEFTLDEPIICKDMDSPCSLYVTLTNPDTSKISMDNCMVKWNWNEWMQPRHIRISAVENFVNDKPFTGTIVLNPAVSRSEYYAGYRTANITVATVFKPSGYCSGTGDPHYTTFDGAYWHVYWAGTYVLYAATRRAFEVQVATRGYPSQHCGFAVRENNDVIVVYRCDGANIMRRTCASSNCVAGSFPKISVYGSSYRVDLESGALVRFDMYNNIYGNMYVTAPGLDYAATEGICGNFNGNRGDDVPIYVATSANQMPSSMIPKVDLFNWKPSPSDSIISTPSPYSKECNYTEPTFIRPVLSNPDVEDITNLIKNSADSILAGPSKNFIETHIDQSVIDAIENICRDAIVSSHVTAVCTKNIPRFDVQTYIDGCVEDLVLSDGDKEFIERAIEDMENKCITEAIRDMTTWEKDNNGNPVQPNLEIQTSLCPNQCSGNGVCLASSCVCDADFQGVDCAIDKRIPPTIESQSDYLVDITNIKEEFSVIGKNFYNTNSLACKIGDVIVSAFYMGSKMILCNIPASIKLNDNKHATFPVRVTTDMKNWSTSAGNITFYNSLCHVCSANSCRINPNSCNIDNVCHPAQKISPINVCMRCQPSISMNMWTFNYDNCGPTFEISSYTAKIVERNAASTVFVQVTAKNPNMKDNPDYVVYYKLINSESIFAINEDGGIYTATNLDASKRAYMITVVATDNAGNVATTNVIVNVYRTNTSPLFDREEYTVNVAENTPIGTKLLSIVAKDSDNDYNWGNITYDLMISRNVFGVVSHNGTLFTSAPLDYEDVNTYESILTAKDGGGQFHLTKVIFRVLDVNEPPTSIVVSKTYINENDPSGIFIGTLSCVDPEKITCYFLATDSTNFKVVNNTLYSNKVFNYEQQSKYLVEVVASDGFNVFSQNLTINIVDVNDVPKIIGLSSTNIRENEKVYSAVSELNVSDEDAGQTVRCIVIDNKQFSLQQNLLILVGNIDYETIPVIQLTITCIDDGIPSLYASKTFDINIIDDEDLIGPVDIDKFPLYENITNGYVVASIKNASNTFTSRNTDFIMIGSNLTYAGNGVDYEQTRRIYVLLEPTSGIGTISLVFDVIDVFDPPIGLELDTYEARDAVVGNVYVVGQEEQDKYRLMLQNHMDLFALKEKTLVFIVDDVPSGEYVLNFIVNDEYPFSLQVELNKTQTTVNNTRTTVNNTQDTVNNTRTTTLHISDDENIGTTLETIPNAKELKCNLSDILRINANTSRIYTIGVPSAKNITAGNYTCQLIFNDETDALLMVYIYDDCYDSPCGDNPCIDAFKSHICNCLNGEVGENCDGVIALEATNEESKRALVGIVVGILSLVAIIITLMVIVLKKPTNKTSQKNVNDSTAMLTNPLFVRTSVLTNSTYDRLNHQKETQSLANPMYSVYIGEQLYDETTPELPLKMYQKDMVRSLANEETSELYGNVAEAKNITIHDLNV
jgi:hypothetical protein